MHVCAAHEYTIPKSWNLEVQTLGRGQYGQIVKMYKILSYFLMYFHSHLRSTNFNVIMSIMALWTSSKIVKFTAHGVGGGVPYTTCIYWDYFPGNLLALDKHQIINAGVSQRSLRLGFKLKNKTWDPLKGPYTGYGTQVTDKACGPLVLWYIHSLVLYDNWF